MTQKAFADWIGVSRLSISEIVNERRAVTPDMAMRLGKAIGNGPQIWLGMQQALDLWTLAQGNTYDEIKPLALT
jgi:addiction module HigA family antidote